MKSFQIACTDDVIAMWLQRTHLLLDAHAHAASLYRTLHYFFGIAVIILSGVMTLPCFQTVVAYLSSAVVIVASVYVFLGFNDTAERHRRATKAYGEIMRGLEAQKALSTPNPLVLTELQERINRTNAEAPDIPLRVFRIREKKHLSYVGEVDKERRAARPCLVNSVAISFFPVVGASQLTEEHYRLEVEHFGRFVACPATFDDFSKSYEGKSLILTDAKIDGKLVGYCVFERVEDAICHLVVVVVSQAFRKQGIGCRLVSEACAQLPAQGITRFSLFTADDPTIGRLFRGIADPVSVESSLTDDEVLVLRLIARHRGLPEGEYGTARVVPRYYTLRDGSTMDATFKLYRI